MSPDTNPTISFKLTQSNYRFLPYEVVTIQSEISDYHNGTFLTFNHGYLQDVEVLLDGKIQSQVFGLPQFPRVNCMEKTRNTETNTLPDQLDESCLPTTNEQYLPPVVAMFKPKTPLRPGIHTLLITAKSGVRLNTTFTIDPAFKDKSRPANPVWMRHLSSNDLCTAGNYFPKEYKPIPLIRGDRQYYRLSFPQSTNQKFGRGQIVWIGYSGQRYEFNLPEDEIFLLPYEQKIQTSFYIHEQLLVNQVGIPLTMWRPCKDCYPEGEYFEFIPMDISGNLFRDRFIWWQTMDSSACDG